MTSEDSTESLPRVGILSLGDMGAGIARLLIAHGFAVATNCEGRSEDTIERARNAKVELVSSDLELVQKSNVILSIVPPRDAEATAQRVIEALSGTKEGDRAPLYYADLNAVSPTTVRAIAASFDKSRAPVRFIDGCILGAPPRLLEDGKGEWFRPNIPISGPHSLAEITPGGDRLLSVLKIDPIADKIGQASGLKMCFASMLKGFTAIATQSFTTAHRLGVSDSLRSHMAQVVPGALARAEEAVPVMVPKAYRWVREMEEIAATMCDDGGWERDLFLGAAATYESVAEDPVLGKERIGKRSRGTDLNSVAELLADGLDKKRKKI
ncbi:Prephenate dehydrogenase, partial [Geosmithia morbida]